MVPGVLREWGVVSPAEGAEHEVKQNGSPGALSGTAWTPFLGQGGPCNTELGFWPQGAVSLRARLQCHCSLRLFVRCCTQKRLVWAS